MAGHKTKRAGKAGKAMSKLRSSRAVKGAKSKTHKGRLDYTTKKGDKVFHRKGHDEKHAAKSKTMRKPYSKSKKGGTIAKKVHSHKAAKVSGHKVRQFSQRRGLEHRPITSGAPDQKSFLSSIDHFFTHTVPNAAGTVVRPVEQALEAQASPQGQAHTAAQRVGQMMAEEPAEQTAVFSGE